MQEGIAFMKRIHAELRRSRVRWVTLATCAVALLIFHTDRASTSRADFASSGKSEAERWDTYPPGSVERERVVGRLIMTLRLGMTRDEVEALIGPADDPREMLIEARNKQTYVSKYYYCQLPNLPELRPGTTHGISITYDLSGPVPVLDSIWLCSTCYIYPVLVRPGDPALNRPE